MSTPLSLKPMASSVERTKRRSREGDDPLPRLVTRADNVKVPPGFNTVDGAEASTTRSGAVTTIAFPAEQLLCVFDSPVTASTQAP